MALCNFKRCNSVRSYSWSDDKESIRRIIDRLDLSKDYTKPIQNHLPNNQKAMTPIKFYSQIDSIFNFDFDPCPANPKFDGLSIAWKKMNYVNPPFDSIGMWLEKAIHEAKRGKRSVFLIPARVDRPWYRLYVRHFVHDFLPGKLAFQGYQRPFPEPLMLVLISPTKVKSLKSS